LAVPARGFAVAVGLAVLLGVAAALAAALGEDADTVALGSTGVTVMPVLVATLLGAAGVDGGTSVSVAASWPGPRTATSSSALISSEPALAAAIPSFHRKLRGVATSA